MNYFAPDATKPGDSIHYSDLEISAYLKCTLMIATIDGASYGGYDNSGTVERSNQRVMLANDEIAPHLVTITGSHGSHGLAYIVPDPAHPEEIEGLPEALRDALSALADHTILDEEDDSELEYEMEAEAWESDGRSRFKRALVKLLDEVDSTHTESCTVDDPEGDATCTCGIDEHKSDYLDDHADVVDALWRAGCDAYNVNGGNGFKVEGGGIVYFYVDEWITCAERKPDLASQHAARYHTQWELVPTLAELAIKCRMGDS